MKLSNGEIVTIMNNVGSIANKSLPVKASYAISKNMIKIEKESEIYNKEREKLVDLHAEKDENGKNKYNKETNNVIFKNIDDWNNDINDLLEIENEIDIHKFSINEIINCQLTPQELKTIQCMITEE